MQAPLRIHMHTSGKWMPILRIVVGELHRAETLEIIMDSETTFDALRATLPSTVPSLRTLHIHRPHGAVRPCNWLTYPIFATEKGTPALKHVSISDLPIALESAFPATLTKLAISKKTYPTRYPITSILTVLSSLPLLIELELDDVLIPVTEPLSAVKYSVSLPYLMVLRVVASPTNTIALLERCHIPAPAEISLQLKSLCSSEEVPLLTSALSFKLSITQLVVHYPEIAFSAPESGHFLKISTTKRGDDGHKAWFLEVAAELCGGFSLNNVTSVHLTFGHFPIPSMWKKALARIQNVQFLHLTFLWYMDVLDLFKIQYEQQFVLRTLKKLTLTRLQSFEHHSDIADGYFGDERRKALLRTLEPCCFQLEEVYLINFASVDKTSGDSESADVIGERPIFRWVDGKQ
ncbi:hypothetical protein EIP91_001116 [Steccherinum ochraceum]|uniref:Uncharacterized protein n=1 Tax=Steccherinum ochraceum TaxID=92696 RepID=A0A4V2MWK5_9APHY|nr:hypothetical protein EIP91_001116 [Steccherinum ochraceum]